MKKTLFKFIFCSVLSLFSTDMNGQKTDSIPAPVICGIFNPREQKDADGQTFCVLAEDMPEFMDGIAAMRKFIDQNIRYPRIARESDIQGTVYVGFIVETDGQLTHITVKRGLTRDMDEEAVRVVKATSGKWKAGKQDDKIVRVAYTIPVKFRLE